MQLSAVCFNFAQHNNEQTLHTLKNTGFKITQFGLVDIGQNTFGVNFTQYIWLFI